MQERHQHSLHRAKNVIYNWKYKKVPNNPFICFVFFFINDLLKSFIHTFYNKQ